jgi:O-antigen ligase
LYFGTRYLFLLNILSTFFIFLSINSKDKNLFKIDQKKIFITFIFILVVISIFQFILYSNILPENLTLKTLSQQGKYGLLIGGRSDLIACIKAISDSPIFGHGSWAKDCFYSDYLKDFLFYNEYSKIFTDKNCLIPGHSIILEAWIFSGFIGFVFWLYILFLIIGKIRYNFSQSNKFTTTLIFLNLLVFWHLFLSPYGGIRIIEFPLYVTILIFLDNKKQN